MKNTLLTREQLESYDRILEKGLSGRLGEKGGQLCIEAALCEVLGLPHGDDPGCVALSVRRYELALNGCSWTSPAARAAGLRQLGLAQLGSLGVVSDVEFCTRLAEKTIKVLIPELFRDVFSRNADCRAAAQKCKQYGSADAAEAAAAAARAARAEVAAAGAAGWAHAAWSAGAAAEAAEEAAWAARATAEEAWAAGAAHAAWSAAEAAWSAGEDSGTAWSAEEAWAAGAAWSAGSDKYLVMSAALALEVLQELKSPGCMYVIAPARQPRAETEK